LILFGEEMRVRMVFVCCGIDEAFFWLAGGAEGNWKQDEC